MNDFSKQIKKKEISNIHSLEGKGVIGGKP